MTTLDDIKQLFPGEELDILCKDLKELFLLKLLDTIRDELPEHDRELFVQCVSENKKDEVMAFVDKTGHPMQALILKARDKISADIVQKMKDNK
jgi:hypothetical protein